MKSVNNKLKFGFSGDDDKNLDFRFDQEELINERRKRFFERQKINPASTVVMIAEHGNRIFEVTRDDAGKGVFSSKDQYVCDGLITREKDLNLALSVADCIALSLYDAKNDVLAMVHLGSKNLAIGTVSEVVREMKSMVGASDMEIHATTGPFIKKCCYRFDKIPEHLKSLEKYFVKKDKHYFLDTEKVLMDQLKEAGLKEENIEISELCSKHDGFPSHKRSQEEDLPESRMIVYARMV